MAWLSWGRRDRAHTPRQNRNTVQREDYRDWETTSLADWLIYHQEKVHFTEMTWMGQRILKNPLDCWIYQEILWEVQPEVVVELGSLAGGSTLFFCHLLDMIRHGEVISVDVDRSRFDIQHPRLREVTGDCSSPEVVQQVRSQCSGKRTLVIHDADHRCGAVLRDLRLYADLVSPGSYLIVEDGIVDVIDPAASKKLGWREAGPLAAIEQFLQEQPDFAEDQSRQRYLMTYNPRGYLRRLA